MNTIKNDSHVVIIDNAGNKRVMKLKADTKIPFFKVFIDCNSLIGQDYHTYWQIIETKEGRVKQITDQKELVKEFFLKPSFDAEGNV